MKKHQVKGADLTVCPFDLVQFFNLPNVRSTTMDKPRFTSQSIAEVIPSDSAFAENYLQQTIKQENIAAHYQAIQLGIADADAGKLINLATVKAK
ncbi:putative transcriptional regulator [Pseudomonas migulae]|uniref:hypothetical protein n=1 Tax=Pseudomonas migulae TaxID=78543 RepID=UPI00209E07EF|nr:hypothetical protein [Pseudomonas migulae]MCP1499935.1 putative transcriptional regulator [Pseudomonas migulae]